MKNNVLISLFMLIVLACVVISGVDSIQLILKSIFYMIAMGTLMLMGLVYVVNEADKEVS